MKWARMEGRGLKRKEIELVWREMQSWGRDFSPDNQNLGLILPRPKPGDIIKSINNETNPKLFYEVLANPELE